MGVITLSKESHLNPGKFRIKYEDAQQTLGPKAYIPKNDTLPPIRTSSKIAIIGAGFGGISTAITCMKSLHTEDIAIFEKHANFGGTWWANSYPGAASDIPAVWYSFYQELTSNWSTVQPPQGELEEYILQVVDKYNIRPYARFQTSVTEMKWSDIDQKWTLYARDLKTGQLIIHESQIAVNCIGGLVHPHQLDTPGLENFKGDYMHSAIWNHDVEIKGKNIVVVGNGCSANQVVPALLREYEPKSVTQIARSKHYILPPVPQILQDGYKLLSGTYLGLLLVRLIVVMVAETRYPLFKGNGIVARFVRWVTTKNSLNYMKRTAPEKYHKDIIPSFKVGCKRMIFDHSYLKSLHDERIDFIGAGLSEIKEHSVITTSGQEVPADVIIACTGYDLPKTLHGIDIIGQDGASLRKIWDDEGITAYQTVLAKKFPNLFFIAGPNSATGHASVVMAIQNANTFFAKVAKPVVEGKMKSIVVKTSAYDKWKVDSQKELQRCVFGTEFGGCVSWYAEGKTNFTTYPYSQIYFWWAMTHPNYKDFTYVPATECEKTK
jgi:cation diffusion facilitator CzcD-associated flavoprotein CzcO